MINTGDVDVFLGLDVGRGEHHGTAVTRAGKRVFDKRLPNSEPKIRAVLDKLTAKHGTVLVVVDQPASIGALPLAVARDAGCRVAYLPGLTMRRIANRLRGLLTQIHPHLERVLGPRLDHSAVLALLERFGSPATLRKAGRRRLLSVVRPLAPRMFERLVEDILAALDEQTVVVPGTEAAALIVPSLAGSLRAVLGQRKLLEKRIQELLDEHPLSKILTSMPGIGTRTGARVLIDVGDASAFPTAAHLASYTGLAPATRSSGSSIRGEQPSRRGNKQLKRAFFLAAFGSLSDPASRTYYDKKISQGKRHTQAILCLARRRTDVLFAMLRDGTFYQSRPAAADS
ncbi:transposase [Streptomyces sp. NPDC051287]|uniref:transposase n=1 Tax=Streptomyces sp. NPDC051287 TaxID=3365648 RepID=UPI003798A0A2